MRKPRKVAFPSAQNACAQLAQPELRALDGLALGAECVPQLVGRDITLAAYDGLDAARHTGGLAGGCASPSTLAATTRSSATRPGQPALANSSSSATASGADPARLAEIARVSGTTVSTILDEFHEVNNADILLLREAVRTSDFSQACFMAHRIQGAHLMLGASRVADSCSAIAAAGQARDAVGLRAALAGLEQQMAVADDGPNATVTAAVPAELPCAGLKFLVVEDHEFQRSLIKRLLGRLGATSIACCESGLRALDEMRTPGSSFDIMILGLALPDVSGMDLMRMIGETRYPVSVILNSALSNDLLSSPTRWARKYDVYLLGALSKPLTREKLEPLISRHRRGPGTAMPAQEPV